MYADDIDKQHHCLSFYDLFPLQTIISVHLFQMQLFRPGNDMTFESAFNNFCE
jgi:hypothetical protein